MSPTIKSFLGFIWSTCKAIAFVPTYVILMFGPLIYYLKFLDNPSDFLIDFAILSYTVGMFSLLIEDTGVESENKFSGIGFLYLLSGSLSILLLFMTPLIKSDSKPSMLGGLMGSVSQDISSLLITLVFAGALIGYSWSFGLATTSILQTTYKRGEESMKDIWSDVLDSLRMSEVSRLKFEDEE